MKKLIIPAVFTVVSLCSLSGQQSVNPSYRYFANPGLVNITEFNYGLGLRDTSSINPNNYLGVTNIFGYQINRNFFGGLGVGFYFYDTGNLIPVYLEYKYSTYLKRFTPYLYADGGALFAPDDFNNESKIFINPGIGISAYLASRYEGNISVGYMVQSRSSITSVTYVNIKLGIIFRKNAFRLHKADNNTYSF